MPCHWLLQCLPGLGCPPSLLYLSPASLLLTLCPSSPRSLSCPGSLHFCAQLILTLATPLVDEQLVAFLAAAFEAANRVSTHVVTAPVVQAALIYV